MSIYINWWRRYSSSFGPDWYWHFKSPIKYTALYFIWSQRLVFTCNRCKWVCGTFNRSPVLTHRNGYSIDSIHNAFVMCSCSMLVQFSKPLSFYDLMCDLFARNTFPCEFFNRDIEGWDSYAFCAKICQYSNSNWSLACNFLY